MQSFYDERIVSIEDGELLCEKKVDLASAEHSTLLKTTHEKFSNIATVIFVFLAMLTGLVLFSLYHGIIISVVAASSSTPCSTHNPVGNLQQSGTVFVNFTDGDEQVEVNTSSAKACFSQDIRTEIDWIDSVQMSLNFSFKCFGLNCAFNESHLLKCFEILCPFNDLWECFAYWIRIHLGVWILFTCFAASIEPEVASRYESDQRWNIYTIVRDCCVWEIQMIWWLFHGCCARVYLGEKNVQWGQRGSFVKCTEPGFDHFVTDQSQFWAHGACICTEPFCANGCSCECLNPVFGWSVKNYYCCGDGRYEEDLVEYTDGSVNYLPQAQYANG